MINRGGYPVFTVAGRPFFVYGAAFFYERIPRERWRDALVAYRAIGINTIDLYAIWNWHEPTEGAFDFDGHSNPRRDLLGVLQLCHDLGLRVILRPGPVIRNEWRNGGYPGWLLGRPAYAMPLHDVLEGRYPATATLQNSQADAAAAQWLANDTHLHYASLWLQRVLEAAAPYAHDIIAVALDDDQGAYIDNDTWPAPHWRDYVGWLAARVRATTGSRIPLFINTYEMKVTAASPVWACGDWYQSDAFAIGDHDRAQIGFSTGLLQTQSNVPSMLAEFQAGWLQGAADASPRPADPSNTTLALNELLALGTHGVVNFPLQDTAYPSGWEAPWANWSYAWDAAYRLDGSNPRYEPTARLWRGRRPLRPPTGLHARGRSSRHRVARVAVRSGTLDQSRRRRHADRNDERATSLSIEESRMRPYRLALRLARCPRTVSADRPAGRQLTRRFTSDRFGERFTKRANATAYSYNVGSANTRGTLDRRSPRCRFAGRQPGDRSIVREHRQLERRRHSRAPGSRATGIRHRGNDGGLASSSSWRGARSRCRGRQHPNRCALGSSAPRDRGPRFRPRCFRDRRLECRRTTASQR